MPQIEIEFGKLIRKYRTRLKLSQEDYADKAGLHRTYISSIELGKVQVSIAVAAKLIDALEVSMGTFWRAVEKAMQDGTSG